MKRKTFVISSLSAMAGMFSVHSEFLLAHPPYRNQKNRPLVISTWPHGIEANAAAWEVLSQNGRALDAVEKGVRITELDPSVTSVGVGSDPDSDGNITLDASIMDENGNCGAVACLQHIKNPISVARKVMEETPHVLLVGEGALQFALSQGFKKEDLHTERSRQSWEAWKKNRKTISSDVKNHDTISMLAIDHNGDISGACTTGGLAFKLPGRVGDSPIIGAGLYVDNEIGGAGATGVGEVIMKILGTHLVVELMRQGRSPYEACKEAVMRAMRKVPELRNLPIYFIAVNKQGEFGAFGTDTQFDYAVHTASKGNVLYKADGVYND